MTPEIHDLTMQRILDDKRKDPDNFANGRTVRNMLDKIERQHAIRLEREGVLDEISTLLGIDRLPGTSPCLPAGEKQSRLSELENLLVDITAEDVACASSVCHNSERHRRRTIGFGNRAQLRR